MNDKEPRHCVSGLFFRFRSNQQGDGMRRKDDIHRAEKTICTP